MNDNITHNVIKHNMFNYYFISYFNLVIEEEKNRKY